MVGDKEGTKIVDDAFWWGVNCAGWSETPLETVSRAEQPTMTDAHGPTPLQGDDYPLTYDVIRAAGLSRSPAVVSVGEGRISILSWPGENPEKVPGNPNLYGPVAVGGGGEKANQEPPTQPHLSLVQITMLGPIQPMGPIYGGCFLT